MAGMARQGVSGQGKVFQGRPGGVWHGVARHGMAGFLVSNFGKHYENRID